MNKFINNQYILYILCFLAITNLLGFLYVKDYDSIVLLLALIIVTSYFSNNNIVQLSVGLIGANFIFVNKKVGEGFFRRRIEGFKNEKEGFEEHESDDDEDEDEDDDDDNDDDDDDDDEDKKKPKKKKNKNDDGKKSEEFSNKKNKIDQSATLKQAYSNISNVLGKGGISNLTKETQELVEQQKDLIKQMSSLGPMIANVSSLAKTMPNMANLLKGLTNK